MKITLDITSMIAGAAIAVAVGHFIQGPDASALIEAVNRIPAVPVPDLPSWLGLPAMSFSRAATWTAFASLVAATVIAVFATAPLRSDERSSYLRRLHRRYPTSVPPHLAIALPAPATPEQFLYEEVGRRQAKLASEPAVTAEKFFDRLTGAEGEACAARVRSAATADVEKALVAQVRDCNASPLLAAVRLALDVCLAEPDAKKRIGALDHLAACAWREIDAAPGALPKLDEFFRRYRKAYPEARQLYATLHHHPCTQLLAQIAAARTATDQPTSAAFVWLRYVDPLLWHVVDNAGRTAFSVAGLGPAAHYEAEKAARSPIATPRVADAARTLVDLCVSRRTNGHYHSVESMAAMTDLARSNGVALTFSANGGRQA